MWRRQVAGEDVSLFGVKLGHCGVQRRRLAAAGRAGEKDYAVRQADQLAQAVQRLCTEAYVGQAQLAGSLVQQPEHHPLATRSGHDRDADVH